MNALGDGSYDALVVDVSDVDEDGVVRVEIAITSGAQKGNTVRVATRDLRRDPLALLGLPVTLRVVDGVPRITVDTP